MISLEQFIKSVNPNELLVYNRYLDDNTSHVYDRIGQHFISMEWTGVNKEHDLGTEYVLVDVIHENHCGFNIAMHTFETVDKNPSGEKTTYTTRTITEYIGPDDSRLENIDDFHKTYYLHNLWYMNVYFQMLPIEKS